MPYLMSECLSYRCLEYQPVTEDIFGNTMASAAKIWKHTALAVQEEMCNNLSDVDWDAYEKSEVHVLKKKIKMLLFGLASAENEEAERLVDKISEVIIKENVCKFEGCKTENAIYMVFVFVVGTKDGENIESWPVFRVPKDDTGMNASFIDINCRVYESWRDFLENNKLPVCEYCYPKDGKYEYNSCGNPVIEFGQAPESKTSKKIRNALDGVSAAVGLGASVVAIASFALPVVAPILVASAWAAGGVSAYSTVRSSTTLYDRKKHKQDIGLRDGEARSCYISIAGSVLGLGASVATSQTVRMAQSGSVLGNTATSAVTALSGGALVMNGVGIVNGLNHLIEKHRGGQLTTLDVAQFSASLLLFCHATVNFKTARSIIEKSQDNVIQRYDNSLGSRWKRIMFRTAVKCTTKLRGPNAGKALVIRNIKHINTVDEYFASLLPEDEIAHQNRAVLISQSNISQIHGFEHLESLLNEYDKFTLRRLLMRFTEPIRNCILGLTDSLFKSMGKACSFDLMHIVSFVCEFVQLLTSLIFQGARRYVLSVLQFATCRFPCDRSMSCYEFCLALFGELLCNPSLLTKIYKLVKLFIEVLSHRTDVPRDLQNVDFIKLVCACSILLNTDKPYWEVIIDFAKNIFDTLHLKKHTSFVTILKELLLFIQGKILEMQKRYESIANEETAHAYDYQLRSASENVLDSLYDDEISTSFANRMRGMNLDEVSGGGIPQRSMESVHTVENPLSFQKRFWEREQHELLSEEEILETCKKTLRIDDFPQNCSIMYDGLETFVTIDDTVVVIRCDLHNETVVSYAVLPAPSVVGYNTP